jgi:predicted Zn-dependent protease
MTRFASFWVEGGRIVAPLSVMRFDDSVLHLLGSRLIDLDATAVWLPTTNTYDARQLGGASLPGILVSGMAFTL